MKAIKCISILIIGLFLASCSINDVEFVMTYNGNQYVSDDEYGTISSLWTITSDDNIEPVQAVEGASNEDTKNFHSTVAYRYKDDTECIFLASDKDDSGVIYRKKTAAVPSIFDETFKVTKIEFEWLSQDGAPVTAITDKAQISDFLAIAKAAAAENTEPKNCLPEDEPKYVANVNICFEDYPAMLFVGKILKSGDTFGFSSNLNPNSYFLGKSKHKRWNAIKIDNPKHFF